MADEVGLAQLTLAALAERLGVRQPSLYKHIDSMADLHRSISLQAKHEFGEVLVRAAVGRSGSDAIRAMSHAYPKAILAAVPRGDEGTPTGVDARRAPGAASAHRPSAARCRGAAEIARPRGAGATFAQGRCSGRPCSWRRASRTARSASSKGR